jgi:hypothetical protein
MVIAKRVAYPVAPNGPFLSLFRGDDPGTKLLIELNGDGWHDTVVTEQYRDRLPDIHAPAKYWQ